MNPRTQPSSNSKQREHVVGLDAPNIVIYGENGVGKSIINLVAGRKLAHTSDDALGCTFQHQRYLVEMDGMSCVLWDTTGLDKGTEGTVPASQAEGNLGALMQGLAQSGGIHLIIYCIRATRFTLAVKRNHDLIYATVFRKKVPVALVATGLEHQQGEMETWWNESEAVLRGHGMWFDAHACVTTLDVEDPVIQQRRSDSQRLLRELVVRYSRLSAWKVDASLISRVLPKFRAALYRTSSMGSPNITIIRKVIVCDMTENVPVEFSPGLTAVWEKFATHIGDEQYEFVRLNKHALRSPTNVRLEDIGGVDVGLLVFYTSTLLGPHIPQTDIDALRTFYDIAGGQICPMIVVLRGCDDEEEVARTCRADVASSHSNIQAYFVSLPSAVDGKSDAQAKLDGMIERLCIEHVEIKSLNRRYTTGQRIRHIVKRASPIYRYAR